jgi:hypothetical protein
MVCSPPFLKLGNGYKDCASRPKFSGTGLSDALVICDTCHRYARWLPCLRKRDQVFPIFFPIYTHVTRCLRQVIWTTHRLWRGSKSERTYFPSWRVLRYDMISRVMCFVVTFPFTHYLSAQRPFKSRRLPAADLGRLKTFCSRHRKFAELFWRGSEDEYLVCNKTVYAGFLTW